MQLSHLNALRAVEATLRRGSFTRAADELGVTPAAVGQLVRSLEGYLGQQLFVRRARGIEPTDLARSVGADLTESFLGLSRVLSTLRPVDNPRRVAVTLPSSFAENWFAPRISRFYAVRSDVDLRLDASNRMTDIRREDYDFALRYSAQPEADLRYVELFGDRVGPVATPEFAKKHALAPERRDLSGLPIIHLDNRTPDPDWADWTRFEVAFGFQGAEGTDGPRLSSFSSGLQAALAGQALVLCGIVEAAGALLDGRLILPFGAGVAMPTRYRYRLVWSGHRALSPVQAAFRDWVTTEAAGFDRSLRAFLNSK